MYHIYIFRWTFGRLLSLFFTSFLRPFDCPRKVLVSLVNYPAKGLFIHQVKQPPHSNAKKTFFRTKSLTCLQPTHPFHVGLYKTQKGNCSINILEDMELPHPTLCRTVNTFNTYFSYTGCFFYWSALKMTKCQTLRKF